MNLKELVERGLRLRTRIFGEKVVRERMEAAGEFGAPLQQMINAWGYGEVWSRPGLALGTRSLAAVAMTAALNRPAEFRVHMRGALVNGCTPEEIREILLMVALYAGIPAANDAHKIANEVILEHRSPP